MTARPTKKRRSSSAETEWLRQLGLNCENLIREHGYSSVYDFWVHKAGDHLSRASLNNLIVGKKDFRVTTLRKVAKLLGVKTARLFSFE